VAFGGASEVPGVVCRGLRVARATATQGWLLISQKHCRTLISLGALAKAPDVLWMPRPVPGRLAPAHSQLECVIMALLLPCVG